MSHPCANRNLLLGILALQNNFISREQLLAAFNAWVLGKERSLGDILLEQAALSPDRHALIEALVKEHLRQHDGDAEMSLAAVSSIKSVRQELDQIADPDVQASLAHVSAARIPDYATQLPSTVGLSTSAGTRFAILRPHAKGGLGEVHVACDQELNREVALKQIQAHRADDPQSRARFVLEAEITGGLEHPGIVPVYGLGTYSNGRPFYAMRFIRGDSLQEAIDRFHSATRDSKSVFETVAFRKLLGRFLDVCNAMQYAHDRGVLHRDLKPGNVMLGKYGETLIVDWGLAKAIGRDERDSPDADAESALKPASASGSAPTQMGAAIGTPAYMSPEQAAGRLDLLGPASDVYSLGASLYCLLTGKPPFEREDIGSLLRKVQQGEFAHPRRHKPEVPRALEAICLKAMAVKGDDRYASPRALADDLERWLADEPVACHRDPPLVRLGRFARKHKPLVATAAAVLLTSTIGLAAGLFFVNAEKNQTELARQREQAQRIAAQLAGQREERQRIAAETSTQEAQEREAETQAVLGFVEEKVFAAARPKDQDGGLGHDVTLAEAIKSALPHVETSFPTQPLIEARLRLTLGWSFRHLGEAHIAREQEERARALYTQHRGPDHPDTLASMNNLALSYYDLGRHAEAFVLQKETLAQRKAKLGPDDPDTLASMNNLAMSYYAFGRHAEALALFEETLMRHKAKLGADHVETLSIMNNLAESEYALDRQAEALSLREETLGLRKGKLGPDHPDTLCSMNNLANSYYTLGRQAEALTLREDTLAQRQAKLGPDHPLTLTSMNNLAASYEALGRQAEALSLREETLALSKAKLGRDHPDTLGSMNNLAASYATLDRRAEAHAMFEETVVLMRAKLGPDHPLTLTSINNLAASYEALGRQAEALALREETLPLYKAKLGPDHADTLKSMNNLAASYEALGKQAEALALREETLARQKVKLGPDHPDTLASMSNLANIYHALGRQAEALALREETLALSKAKLGADHPDTLSSMDSLAASYYDFGRHTEARGILREALSLRKVTLGADHGDTLTSMKNLAVSYDALGLQAEAVALREDALALQRAKLGADHPDTLTSMNELVVVYVGLDRHADALALLIETLTLRKVKLGLDHPDTLRCMSVVAYSLIMLDRGAEAVTLIDDCLKRGEGRVDSHFIPFVIDLRLLHFARVNDAAGCRQTAEMWEKRKGSDAGSLFIAACMRAVTAAVIKKDTKTAEGVANRLAQEEADAAMAWLRQAVAAGYKDVEHMKKDADLDALRGRNDFQKLLADLDGLNDQPAKKE